MFTPPISTDQIHLNETAPKVVREEQRPHYGMPSMEIVVTNNPICIFDFAGSTSTYPVHKEIFAVDCSPEFATLYNTIIEPAIKEVLQLSYPTIPKWAIRPLRLGFSQEPMANPIVVQIVVPHGHLSDNEACSLLTQIAVILNAARPRIENSENVYIDICRWVTEVMENSEEHTEHNTQGKDLSVSLSGLYNYNPPLPGFSIGPKDIPDCAGSLCGYIRHGNDIYALTCEHVATSSKKILSSGRYRYRDGEKKFIITAPAIKDHAATKAGLSETLDVIKTILDTLIKKSQSGMEERCAMEQRKAFLEQAIEKAKADDIDLGYVYATSGVDKSMEEYHGRLDWAILYCPNIEDVQNKHPSYNTVDVGSRFSLEGSVKRFVSEKLGNNFISDTTKYFANGPNFKPLRQHLPESGEMFFKPASRTSGWKDAQYNGLDHTLKKTDDENEVITREYCFVSRSGHVLQPGDSGAVLIDMHFQPIAIIWGGDLQHAGCTGDVTYATPLFVVLGDIERQLGWLSGSAQFC